MSHKISKVKAITLMALATTLLLPLTALAQDSGDDWEIVIGMYAWLPDISGTTVFPSGESGPDIEVGADTILKNLDFTFMGALQARRGRWGFLTDLIYLNEGASESGVRDFSVGPDDRPAGVELDARMDLKSWVVTLAGIYELHSNGRSTTDLIFGTRMLDVDSTLDWSFTGNIDGLELPGPSGSSSVGGTNGMQSSVCGVMPISAATSAGSCPIISTREPAIRISPGRPWPAWVTGSTGAPWC